MQERALLAGSGSGTVPCVWAQRPRPQWHTSTSTCAVHSQQPHGRIWRTGKPNPACLLPGALAGRVAALGVTSAHLLRCRAWATTRTTLRFWCANARLPSTERKKERKIYARCQACVKGAGRLPRRGWAAPPGGFEAPRTPGPGGWLRTCPPLSRARASLPAQTSDPARPAAARCLAAPPRQRRASPLAGCCSRPSPTFPYFPSPAPRVRSGTRNYPESETPKPIPHGVSG